MSNSVKRTAPNPDPHRKCARPWCGCHFTPPAPKRVYRALPALLVLEGRQQEADELQDRWDKYGSYELPQSE